MARRRIGIAIAFTMLLCCLGLTGCGLIKENPKQGIERIESITGVSLPKDAEVEFHHFDMSPDSSYTQYTLFKLQEHPDDFLMNYPLKQVTELWRYDYFVRTVKGRRIKEKHIPGFDEQMMSNVTEFSSSQRITVLYSPSTLQ